jgi:hypothetical protein
LQVGNCEFGHEARKISSFKQSLEGIKTAFFYPKNFASGNGAIYWVAFGQLDQISGKENVASLLFLMAGTAIDV